MVLNVSTSQKIHVQKEATEITQVVVDNQNADFFAWLQSPDFSIRQC